MEDGENNNYLCVYNCEGPILKSFHFEINMVVDLLDNVDIENDVERCFENFLVMDQKY